jgi:hypothetical protein
MSIPSALTGESLVTDLRGTIDECNADVNMKLPILLSPALAPNQIREAVETCWILFLVGD